MISIRSVICLVLTAWSVIPVTAQVNTRFVRHLVDKELSIEHHAYLSSFDLEANDPVALEWSKYHYIYFSDTSFRQSIRKSFQRHLIDTCLIQSANARYLDPNLTGHRDWFTNLSQQSDLITSSREAEMFRAAYSPQEVIPDRVPEVLRDEFEMVLKLHDKKPWKGALLSAVVPGLGKVYAGRPKSFLPTFATHLFVGAQLVESIMKGGMNHPITYVNIGFLSVYYVANIFGGARSVKEQKRFFREEFLIKSSYYFDANCDCNIY